MSIFDDFVNDRALHAFKLTTDPSLPNAGLSRKAAVVSGAAESNGLPLWAGGDKPLAFNNQASVKITDTLGPDRTMECLYVPSDQDAGLIMRNGQVSVEEIGGVLKLNLFPKSPDDGQVVEMNNVVDLSQWVLSGAGASYEDGTITLTQLGDKAVSPLYRMGDGDTLWKLGGEFWGTPDSPNVNWAGDAARLFNSTYFAADGVTMATNGAGYTGNGNAQHFPAYEWTKPDDAAWTMGEQTGITYVRFTFTRDTTWTSTTIKMRNAQFMTSVGTTPAMNDTNTFSGLTPPDSKYHYEFDTEGHSLKVEDYSSSPLQETIEWDREQSLIAAVRSQSSVSLVCNTDTIAIEVPDDFVWNQDDDYVLAPNAGYADAFAIYDKVMSYESLNTHFIDSRSTPAYDSVLNSVVPAPPVDVEIYVDESTIPIDGYTTEPPPVPFGYYMGNDDYRIVTKVDSFDTNEDFLNAEYDTVSIGDDAVSGDSGYWTGSILRPETPAKVEWGGINIAVSMSADGGTTWAVVDNHSVVPELIGDAETIDIRVDFSAGGELRNLTITTFQDNVLQGDMTDRPLVLSGDVVTAEDINYPIEQNPLAGLKFNGGSAVVQTVAGTENVQSIMFWIKPESLIDGSLLTMGTDTVSITGGALSGTAYVNGTTGPLVAGVWNHVIITNLTSSNADITITPPVGQLNMLTIMTETIDEQTAAHIYESFFGNPNFNWTDSSMTISESTYSSIQGDWGITSSY